MKFSKKILSLTVAAATAFSLCAAPAFAATSFTYTYPEETMEVNSTTGSGTRYLTTLAQRASSEIPLILGINIVGGNIFAGARDLGGTNVSENPDPYLWNFNYLYPVDDESFSMTDPAELTKREGAVDLPQSEYYEYLGNNTSAGNGLYRSGGANEVYTDPVDELGGVGYSVGLRTDIMIGFNSELVGQIDTVRGWKSGDTYYQEGDEDYNPLIVDVQTGSVTSRMYTWEEMAKGINAYLDEHPDLTVRYGDPEVIAINLQEFAAGIPYYIASKIADGTIEKKTMAYISQIDGSTLTCVDPRSLGNVSADVYGEVNNFNFIKGTYTLDQIMQQGADVLVLGASGYGYSGSGGGGSTDASVTASKQQLLKDLAALGIEPDNMPIVMDSSTRSVTLGGWNGFNYAPTTPLFVPYIQAYAYMDDLENVDGGAINPAAMVQFMIDEFAHVKDSSAKDVALYNIGSNWDAVDEEYDRVPDLSDYVYDKSAIEDAIREGIEYANSGQAAANNNTLIGAYRQTDTAYKMITEEATTTQPPSDHEYITIVNAGTTEYVDLTELLAAEENGDDSTPYSAIFEYYNSSSYGYGDDLQTTLQNYADTMYDHVWSPDTTYAGTYGYGLASSTNKNETASYLDPFTDVPLGTWYTAAVRYAYKNDLMTGVSDTEFSPNTSLTRAQIVQILYNLEKNTNDEFTTDGNTESFSDVDDSDWFSTAVKWASTNGVVSGVSADSFAPDQVSDRETTATMLYNYATYKEYDTSASADLSGYTDASSIDSWALTAVKWANGADLITGTSATELSPKTVATRAQMAQIMKNFVENFASSRR
ncbi:MAG: S-layer homology domain-containing protein [Anaerovoracaceae bacterium]|jgi:hypothetical protein